jgi:hypothetical protein
MKVALILFRITLLAPVLTHTSFVTSQSPPQKQQRPRLEIELIADKVIYGPKDDIKLKVMVKNDEVSDDVFVYGDMGFGYSASFTLFRRDAKGREVPTRFIDDYRGNPPNLDDPHTFVKLSSGTFLGIEYQNSIINLHLEKPGKYRIWVEYHSPLSKSEAKVTPFWGSEDGSLKSNVLDILIRQ